MRAAFSIPVSYTHLLHEDILDEYNDVLHRPKFKFDRRDIEIALTGLIKRGIFLDAATIEDYVPDPADAIFYEVVKMCIRDSSYSAQLIAGKCFSLYNGLHVYK